MASLVKLVNTSEHEYVDTFNGSTFHIKPGEAELVPDGAMRTWMGDPAARDFPRNRARTAEWVRLHTRVGAYGDFEHLWDANKPPLTAWDMEGNRIWTVLDDPEGREEGSGSPVYTIEQLSELAVAQAETIAKLNAALETRDVKEIDPLEPATDQVPPPPTPSAAGTVGKGAGNVRKNQTNQAA